MNTLLNEAFKDLDDIINKYNILLEADDNDNGIITNPISKAASFPLRAIRFKKTKSIMDKYAEKIISKYEKIIDNFEKGLDRSLPIIVEKGNELQKRLSDAKLSKNKEIEKSIVSEQQKYNNEVETDLKSRAAHLSSAIDQLIDVYTHAINKRIDDTGYVLKVSISPAGQAELKFIWAEKVALIKQQGYEKIIKTLNNKNVKQLESLVAKLNVEIENAADERNRSRIKSRSLSNWGEEETNKNINISSYIKLKNYMNDELPFDMEDDELYEFTTDDGLIIQVYLQPDDVEKNITAVFYKNKKDFDNDIPEKKYKKITIKNEKEAEIILNGINMDAESIKLEYKKTSFAKKLFSHLESLFAYKQEYIKKMISLEFFDYYNNSEILKGFSLFVIKEIISDPKKYLGFIKILDDDKKTISDKNLVMSFLKNFQASFEETYKAKKHNKSNESFISLSNYKKIYS